MEAKRLFRSASFVMSSSKMGVCLCGHFLPVIMVKSYIGLFISACTRTWTLFVLWPHLTPTWLSHSSSSLTPPNVHDWSILAQCLILDKSCQIRYYSTRPGIRKLQAQRHLYGPSAVHLPRATGFSASLINIVKASVTKTLRCEGFEELWVIILELGAVIDDRSLTCVDSFC